jgi:hypothetical protein
MSKEKSVSKSGGDNALTDGELEQVAGGGIKLEGVEGESTHKDHKGEIELVSRTIPTK